MQDILGYLSLILIGVTLGLLGAGGSILTAPVLVYLFHIESTLATFYSLFIIGCASWVGGLQYFKKGWVDLKAIFLFGLPSTFAVFLTRNYLLPWIPETIVSFGGHDLSKNVFLMILFALLMIAAAYNMILGQISNEGDIVHKKYGIIFLQAAAVGLVTGLVGAGGGFLMIPVLLKVLKLPLKTAIGSSLLLIALNTSIGFLSGFSHTTIDFYFLIYSSGLSMFGLLLGTFLTTKIDSNQLKPLLAWFILLLGFYILGKELISLFFLSSL